MSLLKLNAVVAPAAPAANKLVLYLDTADGRLKTKTSAGVVTVFGASVPIVQDVALTGAQNDLALTAGVTQLRLTNATLLTITGMAAGVPGQRVQILSVGAGQVEFVPELAGTASAAANRLRNYATIGNTPLAAGSGTAIYEYDGTALRWSLIAHEQGAWITPTFSAGAFTSPTGSWVVDAGDVGRYQFYLRGRTCHVAWWIATSTVTGSPLSLDVAIPNGYLSAGRAAGLCTTINLGVGAFGTVNAIAGGAVISNYKVIYGGSNWAAEVNLVTVEGAIVLAVQ